MWIVLSISAALSFTGIFIIFKSLELRGIPTVVSLAWVFLIATLLYIGHVVTIKMPLRISGSTIALLGLAGVLSYVGNIFQFRATALAPNPGYAVALISMQALLVTFASIFLFGSDFSMIKGLGVFFCLCGVMLLSLA